MKIPKLSECVEASPVPGYVAANRPQQNLKRLTLEEVDSNIPAKRRQKACNTHEQVINKYKQDLAEVWLSRPTVSTPWFKPDGLTLDCKALDPKRLPSGFTKVGEERYQYNFKDPNITDTKRYRPVAYRMPFLGQSGFLDKAMTVSHLCHHNWCYNWNHHILELLEKNKARNGCPAGPSCRHKLKCIVPGDYSEN
jgi:Zinc-binding loop region of homing endonuclease